MDYQEELKKIQEGGNYWKPKAGQFKVKALSELEEADPYIKKREGQEDEVHPQAKIKISIGEEEKTWTFGKGKTPASTYGQLIELATKHANALTNVEFSVVVKNDGTKNDYTIVA
jgi:DNA-binding protein H-NS